MKRTRLLTFSHFALWCMVVLNCYTFYRMNATEKRLNERYHEYGAELDAAQKINERHAKWLIELMAKEKRIMDTPIFRTPDGRFVPDPALFLDEKPAKKAGQCGAPEGDTIP